MRCSESGGQVQQPDFRQGDRSTLEAEGVPRISLQNLQNSIFTCQCTFIQRKTWAAAKRATPFRGFLRQKFIAAWARNVVASECPRICQEQEHHP